MVTDSCRTVLVSAALRCFARLYAYASMSALVGMRTHLACTSMQCRTASYQNNRHSSSAQMRVPRMSNDSPTCILLHKTRSTKTCNLLTDCHHHLDELLVVDPAVVVTSASRVISQTFSSVNFEFLLLLGKVPPKLYTSLEFIAIPIVWLKPRSPPCSHSDRC